MYLLMYLDYILPFFFFLNHSFHFWHQNLIFFLQRSPSDSGRLCLLSRLCDLGLARHSTVTVKSLQSCPTLCNPIDRSPPGSPVPGILQARTLEWVAISFSNAWKWKVKGKLLSSVRLRATPWTAAYQAPLSMGFARQEYWSGLPLPSPDTVVYIYIPYVFCTHFSFFLNNILLKHFLN